MRRILRARLLAGVLVVGIVPMVAAAVPAYAQAQWNVGFDSFHHQLAQYGDWVYSDRWGLVWQPADVPDDFRPYYSGGHWAYTGAYGWTWASDYDWGDIAFHYGRWVDDPYDGWMWMPGYSWSPGWVVWRSNPQSIGWMPMPPDDNFLAGRGDVAIGISFGGVSVNWNDTSGDYGYSRWYGRDYDRRRFAASWTFIDTGRMADRDYRRVAYTPDRASISIRQTTNITNYTVVNNYVVNRSVDVRVVERASGRPVAPVAPAMVFKHPNTVATVDAGQKIHARELDRTPRGTGVANSAPPPPPAVITKLSDHVATHRGGAMGGSDKVGGAPSRLFTKTTITAPAATTQFHGKLPGGPPTTGPVAKPVTEPMVKPLEHRIVPPTTGPAAKPVTEPMVKPLEHRVVPPTAGPAAKPVTEPMVKPLEHRVVPPTAGPAAKPVTEPMVKPLEHRVVPPTAGPAAKPVTEPMVKPLEHRVVPPTAGPVAKPVTEPMVKPLERRVVPPTVGPAAKPVTEPMVKPLERRVVQPMTPPVVTPPEHKVERSAPVIHNPPPVVESIKPPTKTPDEPKKDEHKNKGEQNSPN